MSAPHVPKRSNLIRHLERNEHFPATAYVWSYVDCLDTSSRIENVMSGKRREGLGWRGPERSTIRFKIYWSVPRRTASAGTAGEHGSVIDYGPRLSLL